MILFYFNVVFRTISSRCRFQFHYDLILLIIQEVIYDYEALFQFHYDLILFENGVQFDVKRSEFQFHYDLILLRLMQHLMN